MANAQAGAIALLVDAPVDATAQVGGVALLVDAIVLTGSGPRMMYYKRLRSQ